MKRRDVGAKAALAKQFGGFFCVLLLCVFNALAIMPLPKNGNMQMVALPPGQHPHSQSGAMDLENWVSAFLGTEALPKVHFPDWLGEKNPSLQRLVQYCVTSGDCSELLNYGVKGKGNMAECLEADETGELLFLTFMYAQTAGQRLKTYRKFVFFCQEIEVDPVMVLKHYAAKPAWDDKKNKEMAPKKNASQGQKLHGAKKETQPPTPENTLKELLWIIEIRNGEEYCPKRKELEVIFGQICSVLEYKIPLEIERTLRYDVGEHCRNGKSDRCRSYKELLAMVERHMVERHIDKK